MEWSKTNLSKAELEKKQKEFMEQAVRMAKKAVHTTPAPDPVAKIKEEIAEEILEEIREPEAEAAEITEEIIDEIIDYEEETAEDIIEDVIEDTVEEEVTFGVFDKDELTRAIESGEISGEGLKQATEILAEMTSKTEAMKKLVEEQEKAAEMPENGGDFGLNGYIDRHNNNCRGCKNGNFNAP